MIKKRLALIIISSALGLIFTPSASAQEAINFNSALQPGKDMLIIRQQLRYFEADNNIGANDLDISQTQISTAFIYGIQSDLTLIFNAPYRFREIDNNNTGTSTSIDGFGDITSLLKMQFYQNDTGPTDTARANLLAGMEIRSGDSNFSSDSYDPLLGLVYTQALGRHGFDAAALWKFNTAGGASDLLRYDLAYVYRLQPEEYTAGKLTALFGLVELNGFYETNGDNEIFISPGIQYVTKDWALEATVQLPIWQDLDHRMEKDFVVGLSLRLSF
ncbi:MAG: hypothetical protein IH984_16625 [Planctomycetes bacterium]|nr:hypothetical protein [Planctomycetota bacterium]